VPAGASTKLSEIIFSNSRRVTLRGTRPWQWWSMRGRSTSTGIAVPFADLGGAEIGHQSCRGFGTLNQDHTAAPQDFPESPPMDRSRRRPHNAQLPWLMLEMSASPVNGCRDVTGRVPPENYLVCRAWAFRCREEPRELRYAMRLVKQHSTAISETCLTHL